jgi:nucleoside 2-deoxyribosyltransferase
MEKRPTAYLGIKYHLDHSNRDLVERITESLRKADMRVFCVARDVEQWGAIALGPQEVMRESLGAIRESDIVVIEATEKGVGIGLEAGYTYAYRLPVVVLHQEGAEVSNTLRGIATRVIEYSDDETLDRAARQVRRVMTRPTG